MRRSLITPSYPQGYAPVAGPPANPHLWEGLVGAWAPMLGPSGGTLKDVSGYKCHGTLTNMDLATDWVVGEKGYALDFLRASSQYALFQNALWEVGLPCTCTIWVKLSQIGIFHTILSTDDWDVVTGRYYGVVLQVNSGNQVAASFGDGSGATSGARRSLFQSGGPSVSLGTWVFLAATITGPMTGAIWFNAESQSFTTSGTGGAIAYSGTPGNIGRSGFDGQIASATVHNRALSPAEIQQHYMDPYALFRARDRRVFVPTVSVHFGRLVDNIGLKSKLQGRAA